MMDSYPAGSALLTDLYELTMAASYFTEGMFEPATFSLFVRRLPPHRSYLVGAGLESVLHYLEGFRFTDADLAYLRSTARFSESFLEYLRGLRFRGEVWAIPEGRLFFAGEPMLEITASMPEAQIVESYVLNQVHFQSLIATKAARCVYAARDRPVIDFSLRRTHGIDAGLKVARSCYIVGFQSTSNILAGQLYGIPIVGTMAHSYVESFPREIDAFRAFARSFPDRTVLLLDTYDTVSAAHRALVVGRELARAGYRMQGVRLDSGDMVALSRQVRATLDQEGLSYVRILASGGWDEYAIDAAVRQGAPIDIFAVGSRVGVSEDAPYSDMAYKLVQYGQRPVLKLSPGKATLPGLSKWRDTEAPTVSSWPTCWAYATKTCSREQSRCCSR